MANLPTVINTDALPQSQKSALRRWFESNQGPLESKVAKAKLHAKAGLANLRAGGESAIVAGGLGVLHATMKSGLDYKGKYPVDAALGAIGLIGGTLLAQDEMGQDLSNVGVAAISVFAFRKSHDLYVAKMYKDNGAGDGTLKSVFANGGMTRNGNVQISKAEFAGESDGWAPGSKKYSKGHFGVDFGAEDPILQAARSL